MKTTPMKQEVIVARLTAARTKGAAVVLSVTNLPKEKAAARLKEFNGQVEKVASARLAAREKFSASILAQVKEANTAGAAA